MTGRRAENFFGLGRRSSARRPGLFAAWAVLAGLSATPTLRAQAGDALGQREALERVPVAGIAPDAAAPPDARVSLPEAPDALPAPPGQRPGSGTRDTSLDLARVPERLLRDEWHILVSPAHTRAHDLRWLIPVAAASAVAIGTDTYTMRHVVSQNSGFHDASNTSSGALRDVFIAAPVALFGFGEATHHTRETEAGLLAGEAMINAYVTDEGIKYLTLRERPDLRDARGHFYARDAASDPSFVSGHAIVAWSSAAVLAGEYTKPWQQAGIYTFATGVSLTRVMAYQHFPSDVLLGAVSGWLIGRYVLHAHHADRRSR